MLRPVLVLLALGVALAGCGSREGADPSMPHHAHHDHEHPEHPDHPEHPEHPEHDHHAPGGQMPHRFENADQWSKVFDEPARDAWQKPDEVVTRVAATPGSTVADLGAGTGYFMARLSRAVGPSGKVLGLDVEPDMIRFMTERAAKEKLGNVEARVVKTDDPGLAPESVDRILVVDTWHHLDARESYVPKLAAALRPGGAVVVVDFSMEAERGPPAKHRIPPEQVVRELEAAGLAASILEESLPDQYIVRGVRRGG